MANRDTDFDRPLYKFLVPKLGEIVFVAKAPHSRILFTDTGAPAACHTHLGVEAAAIRTRVRASA